MFLPKSPRRLTPFSTSALLLLLTLAGLVWGFARPAGVSAASPYFAGFVVTNTNDAGAGSLRQAILDANANPGPDDITFQIPGAGVHTITPLSPLPNVTGTTNIDGYTQPGAAVNSLGTGSNAVLLVELNGSAAGAGASGLVITGNTASVSGLVINRFVGNGVLFTMGAEGTVRGCFIGTNAAGTAALGNAAHGVAMIDSGSNTVGGAVADDTNLISGNGGDGVHIEESTLGADADTNVVQGNRIGLGSGGGALPNAGNGVYVFGDQNTVGGQNAGEGNQIANSGSDGVEIASGGSNAVRGNSIFSNAGLGIELRDAQPDGTVTPNDAGDGDTGANTLQNFPVIDSATSAGNSTDVAGTLDSSPGGGFRLDFYSSPTCDPSGNGEGQTYLGSANTGTDDGGHGTFNVQLLQAVPVGHVVTATLTGESPNTSEFSPCRVVVAPTYTWDGSDNTDWHNAANWDTGAVPTATDIVVIPSAGVTNEPAILAADAAAANVTVQAGRTLIFSNGRTLNATATTVNTGAGITVASLQSGTLKGALTLDGTITGGANSVFRFDGATLTNNGNINVTTLRFGGTSQTLAGTGTVTSPITNVFAGATVTLGSNHTLGALSIDGGGTFSQGASFNLTVGALTVTQGGAFQNIGTGDLTLKGNVSNNGTITLNGGGAACGDADSILLRPFIPDEQILWAGAGTFSLSDVDVSYQAGSALISVLSGTNSGNNGANWTFTVCPAGSTLTVNTNDDADDGACNAAHCSLREAILTANSTPGQVEFIAFSVGGGGAQTISPAAALPTITNPVTIDGTTQPGFGGAPLVELNGTNAGAITAALNITAGGSTVRGLVINRFNGHGIRLASAGGNTVAGNFIGTNAAGTAAQANVGLSSGVFIDFSPNNTVGGLTAAERNLISGNGDAGVRIDGPSATGNRVHGNLIGTDLGGTVAVGNGGAGVNVRAAPGNIVGGTAAAARNVISGNAGFGVVIQFAGANANLVQGNFIGTQADGVSALGPNLSAGVVIGAGGPSGNSVGGTNAGEGNRIAFNGGGGVIFFDGTGNRVLSNSIHSNGTTAQHLGIDLGALGVTPNDAGDADAGANNLQNFPALDSAVADGATTNVSGTLNSTASTVFRVEFFSNATCDASGSGEGEQLLGATDVTTDGNGNAAFNVSLPNVAVGRVLTATATDPSGNTSEFSACRAAVAPTYTLSGRVTDESAQPLVGVIVQLSGLSSQATATDAAGNYAFSGLAQGDSFTVTPSANGYLFTPPSRAVNNLQADQANLDFTGKLNTYTFTGRIVDESAAPLAGVNVHLSGSTTGDTTTDAAGNYSFAGLTHGGSFTVTPSKTDYGFTPPSRTVNNLQADQTNLDFTGDLLIHTLSGRVTDEGAQPLVGVNVHLSGSATSDTTTDAAGNYSFTNLTQGGNFTVTPSANGYLFTPPSRAVNNLQADQTGLDFTGKLNIYTVTGTVVDASATPLAGVNVHLSGSATLDVLTDAAGNYSFAGLTHGGNFTVTPSKTGYGFNPTSRTVNNLQGDQTGLDFTGTLNTYTLSGRVTNESAQPLVGVNVHLSGAATSDTTTDAAGNYSFGGLQHGGNFTVTPSLTNYGFTPPNRTFSNLQSDQTGLDFTGKFLIYVLSGRVTDEGAQPLVGINVRLSGSADRDTTTDAAGNYSFGGLTQGNFTITPSETSFRFTPPSRTFSNLQSDQTGLNFTGRVITYTLAGKVVDGSGAGLAGVSVALAGARSAVTLTDAGGNYSFAGVPAGGSFVVTVEKDGFSFSPPNFVVTDIGADARFDTVGTAQATPTPTPDPADDFEGGPDPDPNKWVEGTATNPPSFFDPLVGVFLQDGLLHVQPRPEANGASFGGLVSVRPIELSSSPLISVEVVQAAQGDGAQTLFSLGADAEHYVRFVVQGASEPTAATKPRADSSSSNVSGAAEQTLLFQLSLGPDKFSASVTYDPVQHRFWRFRHDAPARLVIFETSPDFVVWTERFRAQLPSDQAALIAELSAGTSRASRNPGEALFDNFLVPPSPLVQFVSPAFVVRESDGSARVDVLRTGNNESPLSVSYATAGGTASAGSDYTPVSGTLLFGAGESLKSFNIPVNNDDLTEGGETVNVTLSNSSGGRLGSIPRAVLTILDDESENPINDTTFFVRQHYLDFLGREPDAEGLEFWVDNIRSCGADLRCREVKRINGSAAFFLSIEFQGTGFFVQRLYRLAYGRAPLFAEYLPDLTAVREGVIVGRPGALERLELNKRLFAEQFVKRAAFKAKFDAQNEAQYVDGLAAAAGVTLPEAERTALVVGLLTHRETRANVLLLMAEKDAFVRAEFRPAFVQMQYFGYLRRDPDAVGYNFWLKKLNDFDGDYIRAEMVKAFLESIEYRARFGQP